MMLAFLTAALATVPPATAGTPSAPPPLEVALAEARAAGVPVVIDVFTTWCYPCKLLEKNVFADRKVAAALSTTRFLRYDAEHGPGTAVAARFNVHSYPTVLVLTPDGVPVGSVRSQSPQPFLQELEALRPFATKQGPWNEAALSSRGADAVAMYVGGVAALTANPPDTALALRFFTQAQKGPPTVAARAGLAALPLKVQAETDKLKADSLLSFAKAHPSSDDALRCLETLASWPEPRPFEKSQLVALGAALRSAYVQAKNDTSLNELVYAQVAIGDARGAVTTAEALLALGESPEYLDSLAEALFQAGDGVRAVSVSDRAIAAAKDDASLVASLKQNRERFLSEKPTPTPTSPTDFFSLPPPPEDPKTLERQGLSVVLTRACAPQALAAHQREGVVRLYLNQGKVKRAVAYDPDTAKPLKACLEAAAKKLTLQLLAEQDRVDLTCVFQPPDLPE